jgi:hypothetical protein
MTESAAKGERDHDDFSHTGPGTLAGRFMRRFWQPVYLSKDLAGSGWWAWTSWSGRAATWRGPE